MVGDLGRANLVGGLWLCPPILIMSRKRLFFDIEPYYRVDILPNGNVGISSDSKNAKGRKLSQYKDKDGYLKIKLNNYSYKVHNIVAEYFLGIKPDKFTVNHKNCNKLDNHPDNLEYLSIADNIKHAIKHGLHISTDPTKMPTYIDGRCKDIKQYKRNWYLKNRKRILIKSRRRYHEKT